MRPIYLISKTPYPGVIHIPVLHIHYLKPSIDFSNYQGIIATSKEAINALREYPESWKQLSCLCVSEATAQWAREAGATHVANADGYGDSIPAMMFQMADVQRWLYLRPVEIASAWPNAARDKGMNVDEAVMYETYCNDTSDIEAPKADGVLIFTSPSSIECFLRRYPILPTQDVVAIGKTTQSKLPKEIQSVLSQERSVVSAVEKAREIARN